MTVAVPRAGLAPWALFAAMIAMAGLPIYIHAPKVYVDEYGVSLAAMGLTLGVLRLVDVVQDPALGWLAERWRAGRGRLVAGGAVLMALSMVALFAVPPPVMPVLWFAVTLLVLFSAFSLLTICFYAQGVEKAATLGPRGHLQLAGWREGGALAGVSVAAVAPVALAGLTDRPFAAFAMLFVGITVLASWAMRHAWNAVPVQHTPRLRDALADRMARRLMLLALVNGAPVAVTSTLFLYFVESRLAAPGLAGPFLLLFFLSAAVSAPVWSRLASRHGPKRILMAGMVLSIIAFAFAMWLGAGDIWPFAVICIASGAALGADMVLLPAIFARHLAAKPGGEAMAFGLWNFASKLTLALAAVTMLPLLQAAGFAPGATNLPAALTLLSLLYAALPCTLKIAAIAMLIRTPVPEVWPCRS